MGKFDDYELTWYEKDDLEELEDEFHITEKTSEELDELADKLYWKAQSLYDQVTRLESKAKAIRKYIRLIST